MALVSLETYKTFAEVNSPNQDARLSLIIELTSEFISNYCGRIFEAADYVYQTARYGDFIFVPNAPLNSVTTLEYYNSEKVWTEIDAEEFMLDLEEASIEILDPTIVTFTNSRPYRVTYNGGFANIPSDLKLAAFDLVTYYHKRQQAPRIASAGTSVNNPSDRISGSSLPPNVKRVLNLYRIID